MNQLQFAEDVLARIRARGGQYNERAYLFVLATIEYLQSRLEARRHVSGAELAWACRDFASAGPRTSDGSCSLWWTSACW